MLLRDTAWNSENTHTHMPLITHTHTLTSGARVSSPKIRHINKSPDLQSSLLLQSVSLTCYFPSPVLEASLYWLSVATSGAQKTTKCIPMRSWIWHCTWKVCYWRKLEPHSMEKACLSYRRLHDMESCSFAAQETRLSS